MTALTQSNATPSGATGISWSRTPSRRPSLPRCKAEIADWVEQSRAHTAPFGPPTIDGRPRFDMGAEHSAEKPALRRINNPSDISDAYREVMLDARTVDMVADLIGPDVKFHHCKINLKLSGAKTEVSYHQDFAYTPHTNDDIVTALLFLDDIDESNGCLTVVPGSHKGPVLSLFDGERFTGAVAADEEKKALGAVDSLPRQGRQRLPDAHASCCTARPPTAPTSRAASTSASTPRPTPCRSRATRCRASTRAASCAARKPASPASRKAWSNCRSSPRQPRSSP